VEIPGVSHDEELGEREWTGPRAMEAIGVIASAVGKTTEALLGAAQSQAISDRYRAERKATKVSRKATGQRVAGLMPIAPSALKIARYESHLERSLYRALHELQRLQAARSGGRFPIPLAVDLDVSGGPVAGE